MNEMTKMIAITGATGVLTFGLIALDVFQVGKAAAWNGETGVVRDAIIVSAVIAIAATVVSLPRVINR